MRTWYNNVIYWSFLSSAYFGRICPSSGVLDVKLTPYSYYKTVWIQTYVPNDAPAKTHQQYLITNSLWTALHTISPPRKEIDSQTKPRRSEPSVPSDHWPLPPLNMTKPVARHHPNHTHDLCSGSQDHHWSKNWVMYSLFKSLTWINILITPHALSH